MKTADEFYAKVDRSGPGCYEWQGSRLPRGYGRLLWRGKFKLAHRVAAELAGWDIEGRKVLHACDNPPCCRTDPGHLFVGDQSENMQDAVSKGRLWQNKVTHCPAGHKYTPENTYTRPGSNERQCRTCTRKATALWRRKK